MDSVVTCISKQGEWFPNMLPFVLIFKHRQTPILKVCPPLLIS